MKDVGLGDMGNILIYYDQTCKFSLLYVIDDRSDFLINTLPHLTPDSDTPPTTPLAHLLPYYASLPFPLFKRVLESNLPFEGVQAKFGFAKKAIGLRKKKAASMGMEEAAVLAFKGEEGGGGVEITRKNKKGRPTYWKVEP